MNDEELLEAHQAVQRVQQIFTNMRWGSARKAVERRPVIELYAEPQYDGYGTMTIGEWGGWLVQIMPMIYNDRLALTPKKMPLVYDFGWCFPKGIAAMLAALAWDPDADGEPHGHIKRIGPLRMAGERAVGWEGM